jgi:hypothetical protein
VQDICWMHVLQSSEHLVEKILFQKNVKVRGNLTNCEVFELMLTRWWKEQSTWQWSSVSGWFDLRRWWRSVSMSS